jgi:signal transduction histidine kinase
MVVIVQTVFDRNDDLRDAKTSLGNYAFLAEEALNASLLRVDGSLLQISRDLSTHPKRMESSYVGDLQEHRLILQDIPALEFRAANAAGKIFVSSDKFWADNSNIRDTSEKEVFKRLMAENTDKVILSNPFKSRFRAAGKWVITLTRRISSPSGKFLGIVWASVDTDYLSKVAKGLHISSDSTIMIASGEIPAIAFRLPENDVLRGSKIKAFAPFALVAYGGQHSGLFEGSSIVDGVWRIYAASWVGKYHLLVVLSQDKDSILKSWREKSAIYLLIIILAGISGFVFIRRYLINAQLMFRQQESLAGSSRLVALGEMAGGIAHEINTPLASILLASERILDVSKTSSASEEDLKEIGEFAEIIVQTSGRIARIILGLRNFARDGHADPFETANITVVVDQALGLYSERCRANGIEIKMTAPLAPVFIQCRSVEIGQVLVNLLNNAYDAVHGATGAWIQIGIEEVDSHILIKVADSGRGIAPETAAKLFEPFYTTKGPGRGTGLGLSLSQGLVARHGGQIYVDRAATNTTFVVRLPKTQT